MYKTQLSEFCHGFLRWLCKENYQYLFSMCYSEEALKEAIDGFYESRECQDGVREINESDIVTGWFLNENKPYLVFTFTCFREHPDPYHLVVFIDTELDDDFSDRVRNARRRFFVAEVPQDKTGAYYCEWFINEEGGRCNYGCFPSVNQEDFVNFVINFIENGDKRIRVINEEGTKNAVIYNPIAAEVCLLGVVVAHLPEPYAWCGLDTNEKENIEATYVYNEPTVGDSSVSVLFSVTKAINDDDEIDLLYKLVDCDTAEMDAYMYKRVVEEAKKNGGKLFAWRPSHIEHDTFFICDYDTHTCHEDKSVYRVRTARFLHNNDKYIISVMINLESDQDLNCIAEGLLSSIKLIGNKEPLVTAGNTTIN